MPKFPRAVGMDALVLHPDDAVSLSACAVGAFSTRCGAEISANAISMKVKNWLCLLIDYTCVC